MPSNSVMSVPFAANKKEQANSHVYLPKIKIEEAKKATGAVGAEKKSWNVGDQVSHKAWGKGVVVKVNGTGEDTDRLSGPLKRISATALCTDAVAGATIVPDMGIFYNF